MVLSARSAFAGIRLNTKRPLATDQISKGMAALLAGSALAWWGRGGENRTVWNASFCFLAGAFCGTYWIRSGISSFNTQFYGLLFLLSLIILATRIRLNPPRSDKER